MLEASTWLFWIRWIWYISTNSSRSIFLDPKDLLLAFLCGNAGIDLWPVSHTSGSKSVPFGSRFKRSGRACLSPTYIGDWLFSESRHLAILSDSIKPWPMTWINKYLLHRGQVWLINLATLWPMSPAFWEVAESQDGISLGKFLHGKVSKKIWKLQDAHCILAGTYINGNNWMKQFIQWLVEISQAQWLYCNFTLHYYVKGYLCQRTVNKITREVELLVDTWQPDIPQESRYLLEIPQKSLHSLLPIHNVYWVLAMKVAKTSLQRSEADLARQGTRSQQWEKWPSRNLLEGVQESLYNRLSLHVQGTKRNLAMTQTSARLMWPSGWCDALSSGRLGFETSAWRT